MQQSWRQDADKLTFIICHPISSASEPASASPAVLTKESDSPQKMTGDINLFLRVDDGDEGDSPPQIVGEIELMIAEKNNQRRGFGKAALLVFMRYIIEHQTDILEEFVSRGVDDAESVRKLRDAGPLAFECFSVKIGQNNLRSLALFEGLGFVRLSLEPNFFGEFELRRTELGVQGVVGELGVAGVEDYWKAVYTRRE
ncbi:Acyl-CoA N-acyltransferase [Penicillium waksmanii]|uniref:Acyl-CoA N-acyltransferase n=1 Tax=Penicillium waksmanii TaxID=69791 RepID=UPI0025482898|nr:Acyl-CoA N-acyltransferase [Penicillium waksmanii]KAJ6000244.1 Acyl-CoA N-acyltransferase [Penicillium waksmanii]